MPRLPAIGILTVLNLGFINETMMGPNSGDLNTAFCHGLSQGKFLFNK